MEILWREGDIPAKRIAEILKSEINWSKTTTYTVINRCLEKKAIARSEPNFVCHALVSVEQAREYETNELVKKMYNGSTDFLVASILGSKKLSAEEIARLKCIVEKAVSDSK
jgi:predicted transcriptional regulator